MQLNAAEVKAGPLLHSDKLLSALDAPYQTAFGDDLYPTLIQKAARLAYGIAEAQAFTDGNKRTAWIVTVVFLELNGVTLDVDQDEAAHVIRSIGSRDPATDEKLLDFEGFTKWLACCALGLAND